MLGGAAVAWPLASHAQQGIRTVPRFRTHPQRDLLEPLSSYAQEHESIILSIIRSTAFSRPEPRADMDKGSITDCFAKMRRARILSDRMVTLLREEEHLT